MDFWAYFNGFWIFPLLCFVFMALMMLFGCHSMRFRCGHGGTRTPQVRDDNP